MEASCDIYHLRHSSWVKIMCSPTPGFCIPRCNLISRNICLSFRAFILRFQAYFQKFSASPLYDQQCINSFLDLLSKTCHFKKKHPKTVISRNAMSFLEMTLLSAWPSNLNDQQSINSFLDLLSKTCHCKKSYPKPVISRNTTRTSFYFTKNDRLLEWLVRVRIHACTRTCARILEYS